MACEIKGGSIFNHLLPFCTKAGVTLFSGMNLDLVLNLINIKPSLEAEFDEVSGEAKAGICRFNSEIFEKMKNENDSDLF
jgi:PTS system mannose-specific IIA component